MDTNFLSLSGLQWQCLTVILIGLVIRFIIGRRRFKRRGVAGTQQYSSYSKGLVVGFIERMLMVVSVILIVVSFIFLLVNRS